MDFPTNGGDVWRATAFIAAVQAQFIRTGGERGWEWTERVRKAELRLRRSSAPRLLAPQGAGRRAPQSHSPGAAPTSRPGGGLPSVSVSSSPSPGAAGWALLRTCVPPAATQDTRGRSSARVPCCSPRSHTVSWRAWPGGGACPASSSRWAARFGLENPTC